MKTMLWTAAFVLGATVATGCQQTSVEGTAGKKLTLVKPSDQTVKRGDTNEVRVVITRSNFKDAVAVTFAKLPDGVEVVDKDKKIAGDDLSTTYTLKATDKASLVQNHEVEVTAEGPNGMKVTEKFKITIKDKS